MFAINADELVDPVATALRHTALVSVNVSLKFKMPLVERDFASAGATTTVQNVPTASYGARASETISIVSPSAVVIADAAGGVSAELGKIDSRLRHGIYGGYAEFSAANVAQQIKDDAGYEVIAVPLFSNTAFGEILAQPHWMRLRDDYDSANPTTNGYHDRAIIPITSPMTIHHVIVTNNYLTATLPIPASAIYTLPPAATKVRYQVGVGVIAGPGSDDANYTQVAYREIQADTAASDGMIDFMDMGNSASSMKDTFRPQRWEQAIFDVPIVVGGAGGKGYSAQGKPFFVGEGASWVYIIGKKHMRT